MLGAAWGGPQVNADEVPSITEDFDSYESVSDVQGGKFGNPTLELSADKGVNGSKALIVKDRTEGYFGYSFNLNEYIGNNITITAKIASVDSADQETENKFTATVAKSVFEATEQQYTNLGSVTCTADDYYQERSITADIEEKCTACTLYV